MVKRLSMGIGSGSKAGRSPSPKRATDNSSSPKSSSNKKSRSPSPKREGTTSSPLRANRPARTGSNNQKLRAKSPSSMLVARPNTIRRTVTDGEAVMGMRQRYREKMVSGGGGSGSNNKNLTTIKRVSSGTSINDYLEQNSLDYLSNTHYNSNGNMSMRSDYNSSGVSAATTSEDEVSCYDYETDETNYSTRGGVEDPQPRERRRRKKALSKRASMDLSGVVRSTKKSLKKIRRRASMSNSTFKNSCKSIDAASGNNNNDASTANNNNNGKEKEPSGLDDNDADLVVKMAAKQPPMGKIGSQDPKQRNSLPKEIGQTKPTNSPTAHRRARRNHSLGSLSSDQNDSDSECEVGDLPRRAGNNLQRTLNREANFRRTHSLASGTHSLASGGGSVVDHRDLYSRNSNNAFSSSERTLDLSDLEKTKRDSGASLVSMQGSSMRSLSREAGFRRTRSMASSATQNVTKMVRGSVRTGKSMLRGSTVLKSSNTSSASQGGDSSSVLSASTHTAKGLVQSTKKKGRMFSKSLKRTLRIASPFSVGISNASNKRQKSKWEEGMEVIEELLDPSGPTFEVMTEEQRRKLASVKKYLLKTGLSNNGVDAKTQHVPRELMRIQSLNRNSFSEEKARRRHSSSLAGMRKNSRFILQEYAGVNMSTKNLMVDLDTSALVSSDESDDNEVGGKEERGVHRHKKRATRLSTVSSDDDEDLADSSSEEEAEAVATTTATTTVQAKGKDSIICKQPQPQQQAPSSNSKKSLSHDNKNSNNNNTPKPPASSTVPGPITSVFEVDKNFLPPEFTYMEYPQQKELVKLLSWESMMSWDFDVFRLNEVSNGHPLLLLGWAMFSAPFAQQAMAREIGVEDTNENACVYTFMEDFKIPTNKLCNYLKTIEADYNTANPYHNAIHAADVLQTLHAIIQASKEEPFLKDIPKINLFAILLGAVVHDVEHPGKTNAFHVKLRSELAVNYNDTSVLENHHVAHAFARMLDLDLRGAKGLIDADSIQARRCYKHDEKCDNNILCNATVDQFDTIRKLMIDAILHTDMTKHFAMVNAARGMLLEDEEGKKEEQSWRLLKYMLHMADISSQAKGPHLFSKWSLRCLDEFFLQGDEEEKLGLPISPLCDRKTTSVPESQVGFIQFVVEPAFCVLAEYSTFVQETVIPQLHANMNYWLAKQEGADDAEAAAAVADREAAEELNEGEVEACGSGDLSDDSDSYGSDGSDFSF